jgi:hypothetical protein
MVVATFFQQLITLGVDPAIAKDLTIAYIVKPNLFGQ